MVVISSFKGEKKGEDRVMGTACGYREVPPHVAQEGCRAAGPATALSSIAAPVGVPRSQEALELRRMPALFASMPPRQELARLVLAGRVADLVCRRRSARRAVAVRWNSRSSMIDIRWPDMEAVAVQSKPL
jgi:hypothetical protein